MIPINHAFTLFLSLVIESFPWLLLGIVVSSLLLVLVDGEKLQAYLPKNRILQAIFGSLLGLILPVGQYGNIPVARRLLMQGFSVPLSMSFLVAAPTINPIIIWLTWHAFSDRHDLAIYRISLSWIIAVIIGLIFSFNRQKQSLIPNNLENNQIQESLTLLHSGTWMMESQPEAPLIPVNALGGLTYQHNARVVKPLREKVYLMVDNAVAELIELGIFLVIGCAIASLIAIILPNLTKLTLDPQIGNFNAIIKLIANSTVISINPLSTTLIVSQLAPLWISPSWLAFLLSGSIINLKSLSLLLSVFKPRAIVYLTILVWQLTIILTLALDFYLS